MVEEYRLADAVVEGIGAGCVVTSRKDPSTYQAFCHGTELPVIEEPRESGRTKRHYTACPLWRARREADWVRDERVAPPENPNAPDEDLADLMEAAA